MTGLSEAVSRASQLEQEMRANSQEVARLRNQFMSLYSQTSPPFGLGDTKQQTSSSVKSNLL